MKKIEIKDLFVSADNDIILNVLNLTVNTININEIHTLMGPNGNGKSTLLSTTIMGHPNYTVENRYILIDGKSILDKTVDERSKIRIFFAM